MSNSTHEFFSRAGKNSLEKYKILLEKDEILSNKTPKPIQLSILRSSSNEYLSYRNIHKVVGEDLDRLIAVIFMKSIKPHIETKDISPVPSAVFKSPDRNKFKIFSVYAI